MIPVAWAYAEAAQLTEQAGIPEVASTLLGGFPSLEEVRLAQALWEVSHGQRTLASFCDDFGFHGPVESELAASSWREDPAPIEVLLDQLRVAGSASEPVVAEHRRGAERRRAERAVRRALGPVAARASVILTIGRRYVPLRQVGKASLVQSLDAARACAWALGQELQRRGVLADADDACMLTVDELVGAVRDPNANSLSELTAWRRAQHAHYLTLTIPRDFFGVPEPIAADDEQVPTTTMLRGQGVSAGVVEGTARVVASAHETIEPGEILVCPFTDPGWTPLLVVASGVVLDVGGSMSHGAIIARELGIPCVLGTQHGTVLIATGDRLRVDADEGVVEILERADASGAHA